MAELVHPLVDAVERFQGKAEYAVEAARGAWDRGEDALDELAYWTRRYPRSTVGAALVVGYFIGKLFWHRRD